MSRISLNFGWLLLGLAGCQGLGGYSAQSVTRVPPIGTGTYQVPGSYYGNAAAPASAAAGLPSTAGMTASATDATDWPEATTTVPVITPQVATADYTAAPGANMGNPAVTTASGLAPSTANQNLRWQP